MLGLKRVLFPATSPELSIDLVIQGSSKRQRTVQQPKSKQSNAIRSKQRLLLRQDTSIVNGGILACVCQESRNEAKRKRLKRESKRNVSSRTSKKPMGSVLMNLENIGNIDKNERNCSNITSSLILPMDSLAGVVQDEKNKI